MVISSLLLVDGVSENGPVSFPVFLRVDVISAWFDLPNRAKRINTLLTDRSKLSVEDFKRIQNDQTAPLAQNILPMVLESLSEVEDFDEVQAEAYNILKDWDCNYDPDVSAPLIFETFYMILAENIIRDEMSDSLYEEYLGMDLMTNYFMDKLFYNKESVLCDDVTTEEIETLSDMIQISFKETVKEFKEKYGKEITGAVWGDFHKIKR